MPEPARVFLLSPARLDGPRAQLLRTGQFDLARRLRTRTGAPIGEVFAFVSGLYFRGKLAYAETFARPPAGHPWLERGVLVITQNRGLVPSGVRITEEHLDSFASTDIGANEVGFVTPLLRDAELLAEALGEVAKDGVAGEAVLLGSLATTKYLEPLSQALGKQLRIPTALIGKGDMSRGSILLKCVREKSELNYGDLSSLSR